MTKLFVYGVNARCPKDILEDEFSRCGKVDDVYITEKGKIKNQLCKEEIIFTLCLIALKSVLVMTIQYLFTTILQVISNAVSGCL